MSSNLVTEDAAVTLALPADLVRQIRQKAQEFGTTIDVAACVLLRYGLDAQTHRESDITRLTEQFISSTDARADQLGELIFGK